MTAYSHFSRYYDELTENVDYPRRAACIDRLVKDYLPDAELLLDLACGTGNFSFEMARLGYDVTGVDVSPDMLSVAMQKRGGESILFLNQSMEELDLYGTVDVTISMLDSFNHITDISLLNQAIGRLKLFIAPGGLLLFDVNTEYKHRDILGNHSFVYDSDGVFCTWRNQCSADGTVEMTLDFFAPGECGGYERYRECFCERLYSDTELREMLVAHYFTVIDVLDGDSFGQPEQKSQRLLYIAKRCGS